MTKKIRFGNVVLCEYVGQGSNHKHVLVNTYSGNVIVGALPADISFGLYVEILQKPGDAIAEMDLELIQASKTVMRGKAKLPAASEISLFIIQLFQLSVTEPGDLEVFFTAPGFARSLALKKSITIGPMPSLTLPTV